MEWSETGFILGTRRHGESSVIVESFTNEHGRYLGLVRGGRGKQLRAVLQPGNSATFTWRARLSEHLGQFTLEPEDLRAASLMVDQRALAALNSLNALVRLLPERDPHAELFARYAQIVSALAEGDDWPAHMVLFELALLRDLGFGLDLESCVATGTREDLIYVSPKSGRAVSARAGEPYKDRLFSLPHFLYETDTRYPSDEDLKAGFALTGYFMTRHIFEPRAIPVPEARGQLLRLLKL